MLQLNPPAQEPLGGVLESDDCANHYPIAKPFLYLSFIQRTLPERFECRVGWKKEGEPSTEDGLVSS